MEDQDNPLERLDLYNAALVAATVVVYVLSYASFPHVMPKSARPGFISFCTGACAVQYVRAAKETPGKAIAWPTSSGTPSYNMEGFAADLVKAWDPSGKLPLCRRLLRKFMMFYLQSHMWGFLHRWNSLLEPYFYACVIAYMNSPDVPQKIGYKLALFSALRFILRNACEQCDLTITTLACHMPISNGLRLLVLRKVHRLAPAGRARTTAGDVQQAMKNALDLGGLLSSWNLKTVVADVAFALYSARALQSLSGFSTLIFLLFMSSIITSLVVKNYNSIQTSLEMIRGAEQKRSEVINWLISAFRPLRSYDWVQKAAVSLEETVATERAQTRRVSFLGSLAMGLMMVGTKLIVPFSYFVSVFVRGGGVSFQKGLVLYANTQIVAMCFGTIGGCFGKWAEIKMRSAWLEAFLRLPEREDPLPLKDVEACNADCVEIVDGTFVWPPSTGKDGQLQIGKDIEQQQAAAETYKANEAALWMVGEGPYAGNWVPCRVEGLDEASGLYTVAVLPTSEYASAGGASGQSVSEVSAQQLCKVSAAICEVRFRPREGELVVVSGDVGAGKSSLLLALIGEMVRVAGSVKTSAGSVAFQPQTSQLLDGTIKHNVMLGVPQSKYDDVLLQKALLASQLAADMANPRSTLHAKRENTVVGKDGTLLSGGQRARTALARSVYSVLCGARLAVLDDPVASVDNEVLRNAWEAAVLQAMRGATRIVAVNAQLLRRVAPSADRLVLLEGGRIVFDGPPAEGLERAQAAALSSPSRDSDQSPHPSSPSAGFPEEPPTPSEAPVLELESSPKCGPSEVTEGDGKAVSVESAALAVADLVRECEPLQKYVQGPKGERAGGAPLQLALAQWEALRVRLLCLERGCRQAPKTSGGFITTVKMIAGFFDHHCTCFFPVAAVFEFVAAFETAFTYGTVEGWDKGTLGLSNAAAWLVFVLELVVFTFIAPIATHITVLGVSGISADLRRTVHRTLTSLGMPYFWRGREQAETAIRTVLSIRMEDLAVMGKMPTGLLQISGLFIFTFSKKPSLLPLAVLSAAVLATLNAPKEWIARQVDPQEREIAAELEVRALEHFSCQTTLCALGCTAALEADLRPKMMVNAYAGYWRCGVENYVGNIGAFVHLFFIVSGKLSIMSSKAKGATGSDAMLYDSLIMSISLCLSMLAKIYVPFIMLVGRFQELRDFLDTEFLEDDSGEDPPPGWPTQGQIFLENVTFRYVPYAPAALQDVSLEVRPQEKLGIVGRTGAGKSTLVSLLLRLGPLKGVPPSSGGRILLDGVDIAALKLSRLRRAIALVPQDPVIFKMSLKDNVGGEEFTDAEVATALSHCGLDARQLTGKDTLPGALATEFAALGLSTGHQQMLMTARALVRRPKVLVLDECTASLDYGTADQVLQVIGTHCADATVLSIAHRLRFVLRCDRILVLESGGRVLSLDTPANLMREQDGYFATCLRHEALEDGREG